MSANTLAAIKDIEAKMAEKKAAIDAIDARIVPVDAEIDALLAQQQEIQARIDALVPKLEEARGMPALEYLELKRSYGVSDVTVWRKSYLGIPSPFAEEMAARCDAVINGVGH